MYLFILNIYDWDGIYIYISRFPSPVFNPFARTFIFRRNLRLGYTHYRCRFALRKIAKCTENAAKLRRTCAWRSANAVVSIRGVRDERARSKLLWSVETSLLLEKKKNDQNHHFEKILDRRLRARICYRTCICIPAVGRGELLD